MSSSILSIMQEADAVAPPARPAVQPPPAKQKEKKDKKEKKEKKEKKKKNKEKHSKQVRSQLSAHVCTLLLYNLIEYYTVQPEPYCCLL